jgi:hypothetical protein
MTVPAAWADMFDEGAADLELMRQFRAELAPFLERLRTVYLPAVLRLTERGQQSAEYLRDKINLGIEGPCAGGSEELLGALDEVLGLKAPPPGEVHP